MFSILILTYNEEENIESCLDSISWCDDIWIVDSGSTDRTVELAEKRGCHILTRKFDNFGNQRNYAIDNAKWKHEWVFDLDADEHFTPALRAECEELVKKDEKSGYFTPFKVMLFGKWIKHASQYPVYVMRLHKLGEIRFVGHGHGQREIGAVRGIGHMKEPFIHYNFSKGLGEWFAKHAKYALQEAKQQILEEEQGINYKTKVDGEDAAMAGRRRIKRFVRNFPGRSWLKFFYMLIIKGGILDGPAGWLYCRMVAHYEFMCTTILKDLRLSQKKES